MKRRFQAGCWLAMVAALLLAGCGGKKEADDAADKKTAQVAPVQIAGMRRGEIERTLTAYGTAAAAPGGTRSLSFPFECRVVAVRANAGQLVAAGDVLLQIEPSADARLALDQARGAQQAAEAALLDVQRRFKARLATNADLATADAAARDARVKLDSLLARAPGGDGSVRAPGAGLVTSIPARPGAVVPAGGPLVELAVENRLEARIGLAPAEAAAVKPGQAAHLTPVDARGAEGKAATDPFAGTVRIVGGSVDPATRLVDAFITIEVAPDGAAPMSGTFLRAEIVLEKKEALLAPRAAVLPGAEGDKGEVFTVRDGKAVKHEIGLGLDDGESVEITSGGDALPAGAKVVTEGAYELEDGMAVEPAPAAEKPDGKEDKVP